ncbi:CBN-PMP-2 protein [Caenorhabditis brenneri]|uniref:CBN-PMP-2 protein n=1 Tax=Caenorhabditis brenneri TaxID=135651 RepID=G0PJF8_CAEBE|nr:CBN-PMP-2 protein [Caenorhabditis brenneri]
MAVLSKLQLLGQAIPPKQYAPGMVGMLAVFALIKLYKQDIRETKHLVAKTKKDGSKGQKAHVDGVFLSKLARILKILIPSLFSKETFYLALIAISLLCRTYADVYMIITSTKIEASIIDRNPLLFALEAFKYVLNLPAISVTNALLKFGIAELKLRFRERLSTHLYSQYLKGFTFYKMSNLDTRIQNADQLLTQDVDRFCDGIVELYSNLSKPILDVFLYLFRLGTSLGFSSPSILFSYLLFTGVGLTYMRRPV